MAQEHIKATSKRVSPAAASYDRQLHQLRWFFVNVLTLWTLAALITPVVVFCLTQSPLSFSLFSSIVPPVYLWSRFAKYVLRDEATMELERLKIATIASKSWLPKDRQ